MGNTLSDGLTQLTDVFSWVGTNFPIVFAVFITVVALGVVLRVARRLGR